MRTPQGSPRAARAARATRGSIAAAVAVLVAGTAHTLSGGGAPPVWLMLAVTILATPACMLLASPRCGRAGLAAAVAAAQLALHGAFAAVGAAGPASTARDAMAHGAHAHLLALFSSPGSTTPVIDAATALMTAGHVGAAALTFVLLAWGETMLGALARGIRRVLRRRSTLHRHPPVTVPISSLPRRVPLAAPFSLCVSRRGPPVRPVHAA